MDTLQEHHAIWQSNPTLRAIYTDLYEHMAAHCVGGPTLEIGGGIGNFKAFASDVTATDIQHASWLDVVCDAHRLPFADASFTNVVMFDVLHHLERPKLALIDMARVLVPGGRIVMIEPGITPGSYGFYKFLHPEPCVLGDDPLVDGTLTPDRDPYDANQAIPSLLVGRDKKRFEAAVPELRLHRKQRLSLFAYPLSGGYKSWSLISARMVRPILAVERALMPILGPVMAFRLLIVLERSSPDGSSGTPAGLTPEQ